MFTTENRNLAKNGPNFYFSKIYILGQITIALMTVLMFLTVFYHDKQVWILKKPFLAVFWTSARVN